MSSSIKDLYDYVLVKNCSKCGITSFKTIFHKNKSKKDGLCNQCKVILGSKIVSKI